MPILLSAFFLSSALSAKAQVIRGVVVEADAAVDTEAEFLSSPVPRAEVELLVDENRSGIRTETDSAGFFQLRAPEAGTFRLGVEHPAYLSYQSEPFEIGADEAVVLEVRLGRNVIPLEPLIVTARINSTLADFHSRRTRGGFATFLTREEVEARAAGRTTDLLRGLPGIRIDFQRWGVGPAIEMQGGFGSCEPTIFIDGVEAPQSTSNSLNDFLSPDRIEGVEVYTSHATVPAQFRSGMCGVILFWTRRGGREGGDPWSWRRMLLGFGAAVGLILWIL